MKFLFIPLNFLPKITQNKSRKMFSKYLAEVASAGERGLSVLPHLQNVSQQDLGLGDAIPQERSDAHSCLRVVGRKELLTLTWEGCISLAFSWQECARGHGTASKSGCNLSCWGDTGEGGSLGFAVLGSVSLRCHLCSLQSPGVRAGFHQAKVSR